MKRGRNQRRRPGANPNRALDSNGPEVRIRGTANQVYDKYIALARDATSAGDRVKAENYFQHAEHYFRVLRASQPAQPRPANGDEESGGDQPALNDREDRNNNRHNDQGPRQNQNARPTTDAAPAEAGRGTPVTNDVEAPVKTDAEPAETASAEETEKKPRRRRTRRPAKTAESKEAETAEKTDAETATAAE